MNALPVVLAGGGPGGSATAVALRRRGVPVVLCDRAVFPRDKVCGDVVLPEAQSTLAELGLDVAALRAQAYLCTGSRYVAPGGKQVSGRFHDRQGVHVPWWMVKRSVLDHWLLENARRLGTEVREGWEVTGVLRGENGFARGVRVRRPDGSVEELAARAVVGADGASSAVARSLGVFSQPPQDLCLATRAYVKGVKLPEPYLEIFTTPRCLPGCAWIIPVGPDEVNVGMGVIRADAERLKLTPKQLFEETRAAVPLLQERLKDVTVPPLKGWSLPGASERRQVFGDGWLLVGDAGAMVDPFTGHGIHHAVMAGAAAGDVLAGALERDDVSAAALAPYLERCKHAFLEEAWLGQRLQRVHARPAVMDLAISLCRVHPGVRWLFLAMLGHTMHRRDALLSSKVLRGLFSPGPTLTDSRPAPEIAA